MAAWEAWLVDHLGGLGIDADVYAPYVTGVMEDTASTTEERASSVVCTDPQLCS